MDRRRFLSACVLAAPPALSALDAAADASPRLYSRALLVDPDGAPIRARSLEPGVNYLFHYPYASTPCFLLDLGRSAAPRAGLKGKHVVYDWEGGVGPNRSIVAYSAICAHRLAYPTREITFIRYQVRGSASSRANVIHCCSDHSIYDPAAGGAVVRGPAEQGLAVIVLEHDPERDEFHALGTRGPEQFDAFFDKYRFRLAIEYGEGVRSPIDKTAVVRELRRYCRQTVEC